MKILITILVIGAVIKILMALTGVYALSFNFIDDSREAFTLSSVSRIWHGTTGLLFGFLVYGIAKKKMICWITFRFLILFGILWSLIELVPFTGYTIDELIDRAFYSFFRIIAYTAILLWWKKQKPLFMERPANLEETESENQSVVTTPDAARPSP